MVTAPGFGWSRRGIEGRLNQPVIGPPAALLTGNEAGVDELLEVMRHRRLRKPDRFDEIANARLGAVMGGDERQQPNTGRVTESLERASDLLRRGRFDDAAGQRRAAGGEISHRDHG